MISATKTPEHFPPSKEWWLQNFLSLTGQGLEPFLFKSVLPNPKVLVDDFIEAFGAIRQSSHRAHAKVRVYVGEDRRDDLVNHVLDNTYEAGQPFPEFVKRVVNAERFSLVVNSLQDWNSHLKATMGSFLCSYFQAQGVPIGGTEMVAFAGNYAGTAFGVHRGFEHAFLAHLGPGVKDFYCWSEELYHSQTGGLEPTFGNYANLLESGTKFVMEAGDVLYLPALVYHVGRQEDFSVSIACPLYTYPYSRLLKHFLADAVQSLPDDLLGRSRHYPAAPAHDEQSNDVLTAFDQYSAELRLIMDRAIKDHWKRLVSHGYFDLSQVFYEQLLEETSNERCTELVKQCECKFFKVEFPNTLILEDAGNNQLNCYLGGRKVSIGSEPLVELLATKLRDNPEGTLLGNLTEGEAALVYALVSTRCAQLHETR